MQVTGRGAAEHMNRQIRFLFAWTAISRAHSWFLRVVYIKKHTCSIQVLRKKYFCQVPDPHFLKDPGVFDVKSLARV